jgi:hypothetical protein
LDLKAAERDTLYRKAAFESQPLKGPLGKTTFGIAEAMP